MSEQGVAQRVIDDMDRQRGRFETEIEHIAAVRAGGMRILLDELSAEARRVLVLLHASTQYYADLGEDELAGCHTQIEASVRTIFVDHFGLDLNEPEDNDE